MQKFNNQIQFRRERFSHLSNRFKLESVISCLDNEKQNVSKLYEILIPLDNSETPIDKLAEDVKIGAQLIKELKMIEVSIL